MNFFWIDLETTGLDPAKHEIAEVACVVTDQQLNKLDSAHWVVKLDPAKEITPWCLKQHGESGLLAACENGSPLRDVEDGLIGMAKAWSVQPAKDGYVKPVLAGNSIHFDRSFLSAHMPRLVSELHYRQLDVSTLKILVQAWAPSYEFLIETKPHRAVDDLLLSIEELKHYRRCFGL